jgi:hypothetical protein
MPNIFMKVSGTLVLPEVLLDEILSAEKSGLRLLEGSRDISMNRNYIDPDTSKIDFDISGNRVKVISELTGNTFRDLLENSFRVITETIMIILEKLDISRSEFAKILSVTDIHVIDVY